MELILFTFYKCSFISYYFVSVFNWFFENDNLVLIQFTQSEWPWDMRTLDTDFYLFDTLDE